MKREFLEELKLEKELIDKIMAENGKDIEAEKAKVTTKSAEIDGLKTQLNEANKQIESFKGMDIEGIKKAADEYKTKAEQAEVEAKKQIEKLQFEYSLESELQKAGARNPKTVKALLNMESLKNADGAIIGLKEQLEKLKTDEAYLFNAETGQEEKTNVKLNSGSFHSSNNNVDYDKMSDEEYYKAMQDNNKK
jgi:small-conductance mechanosensitive channel